MTRPCRELEEALGHGPAALSEAQRLALELHVAECAECRALHAMSRSLSELVRSSTSELPHAARERAIAGAFASAATVQAQPSRWRTPTLVALAVAAAALALLFHGARTPPADAWVDARGAHTFGHARVTLLAGARVRFDERASVLTLAQGAIELDVDPAPHAPFAVETPRLRVEVLGTAFRVEPERVLVHHGHVRVVRGGRTLADLHDGERFDLRAAAPERPSPPQAAPAAEPQAAPAAAPQAAPAADPSVGVEPTRSGPRVRRAPGRSKPSTPPPVQAQGLLNEARAALARDALDETRRLLQEAEAVAHAPSEHAEAGTLRAELALRERDTPAAIRAYLDVAQRFAALRSGENALFAAAQLSSPEAARPLLERYLTRYPQGRFAAQVRARMRAATR